MPTFFVVYTATCVVSGYPMVEIIGKESEKYIPGIPYRRFREVACTAAINIPRT